MYELDPVDIVFSFVLTWVIGLTPPLVIRYAIVKGPMDKWPAFGACAFFWFFNLFLFIFLGSQSKSHGVLIFIAFVSYWILRKKETAKELAQYSTAANGASANGTTPVMRGGALGKTKQIQEVEHSGTNVDAANKRWVTFAMNPFRRKSEGMRRISMKTGNQLRQRIKPGWSLLIGVGLALSWFSILFMNGYASAQSRMESFSLEHQVRKYVSGSAKLNDIFYEKETAEKRLASCKDKMLNMFGSEANVPTVLSVDVRNTLLQYKDCDFYESRFEDWFHPGDYAQEALVAGVCGATLAFFFFWVVTYPHIGWRRLALAVDPLAAIFAGLMWADKIDDVGGLIALITIVAVFSGVIILAARDAVEWIRRGFKEPTKH